MRNILFALSVALLFGWQGMAQNNLQPLKSFSEFKERLEKETAAVNSIESDFIQEKYLDIFNEKIISKGRFYYKKQDKIRMDYTEPMPYQIVINGQKLKIVSEGKTNIITLGNNPVMQQMKSMLAASMTGNLENLSSDYMPAYYETGDSYIIHIQPRSETVRSYIREIRITLDKTDMSVRILRLSETEKDYTEYHFINRKHNQSISDELFVIP